MNFRAGAFLFIAIGIIIVIIQFVTGDPLIIPAIFSITLGGLLGALSQIWGTKK
ncbi:MAG: hypothetical protein NWE89_02665 [Candidatus Bathyarchaeota archaeon]|nr:hypothetical protein [Candidatus Bathyarchaeota archaeon]